MLNKRTIHSVALNAQEEKDFLEAKKKTGMGATAMFRAQVKLLKEGTAQLTAQSKQSEETKIED